jgi:hypothetical protein
MPEREQPLPVPGYTYESAQRTALELEALLKAHKISITPNSLLEQVVLSVLGIVYQKDGSAAVPITEDVRTGYRAMIGINELGGLILTVRNHADFTRLVPHLSLLNEGAALQNVPSEQRDQATRKLFELLAATLAMQCGENVLLDDPHHSRGDNPDVLAQIGGRCWGIACKVLHSIHPEGFVQHLERGPDQIERSPAETGVVMFNLKNVIDHDRYWPFVRRADQANTQAAEFGCFADRRAPFSMLAEETDRIAAEFRARLPRGYLEDIFDGKKSAGGFFLWAHTAAGVQIGGQPVPTSVRAGRFVQVLPVPAHLAAVIECLNWAAYADSPDRGPCPLPPR